MKLLKNLGAVVRLENGIHKLMICGRYMKSASDDKEYNYMGILYPEGYIGQNLTFLFNDEDIHETFSDGFTDGDDDEFLKGLRDG